MRLQTIAEGIALANNTRFALGASVYGRDKGDCEYAATRLRAGMVAVNDFGVTVRFVFLTPHEYAMTTEHSTSTKLYPLAASDTADTGVSAERKVCALCVRPKRSLEIASTASSRLLFLPSSPIPLRLRT